LMNNNNNNNTTSTEEGKPKWPDDPEAEIPDDIRGLIFDCDGTLINTMPIHYRAWVECLQTVGINFPEDQFLSLAGMASIPIIELLAREQGVSGVDAALLSKQKEKKYLDMLPQVREVSAVANIVRRERRRHEDVNNNNNNEANGRRKLAVASGGVKRVVLQSLSAVGLDQYFDVVLGADDVTHGKPDPEIFLEAARRMGVSPSECLVYEDGLMGFEAAKAANIRFIDVKPWY